MTTEAWADALGRLLRTPFPNEQHKLREPLRAAGGYATALRVLFVQNPFFRLTDAEADTLCAELAAEPDGAPMAGLIAARHRAMRAGAPRYVVFCMPKSGSSFVQSALTHALQLPFVSLTSFGTPEVSSMFGMNGREQELDELAVLKCALTAPQGFVAQHHTRYTPYLALQMGAYGLTPVVTVRNILDALVSYDDMMMEWREGAGREPWISDGPFVLPRNYPELAAEDRYRVIGATLGTWLLQFHVSWVRSARLDLMKPPLVIRYEEDVLDPESLTRRLGEAFELDGAQRERLRAFAEDPDRGLSRFNVGRAGRGRERIPDDVRRSLLAYARTFEAELPPDDIAYLLD